MSIHAQEDVSKNLNMTLSAKSTLRVDGKFESLNTQVLKQIEGIKLSNSDVLLLATDVAKNYYLVDTSILTSEFEQIYFYKTIIKKNLSIQIEHGLPAKTAWIISDNTSAVTASTITSLLSDAKRVSSKMSATEKTDWLSNN